MPFEKGNAIGAATRFRPGASGNPAGRPYYPTTRADAIREVLAVAEEVLADPAMLDVWREKLRAKWQEDPFFVLRQLLPFMPREVMTLSREVGGTLQQMTVSQLRQIVATLPQGEQDGGEAIDVDPGDDDPGSGQAEAPAGDGEAPSEGGQAALPPPAEALAIPTGDTPAGCTIPAETVTKTVTIRDQEEAEDAETLANIDDSGGLPSDCLSEDEELRLV
jgi:hypothetical protein